ncbi:MAG: DUF1844 domain-containing protein [Bacteroidota bacterium]
MNEAEKNSALFINLVVMLHGAVMQHLGKIKNPVTDAVERNLDQAQMMIDMLDMIGVRTTGNLTSEEERLMKNILQEVKLNYVEELEKDRGTRKESP